MRDIKTKDVTVRINEINGALHSTCLKVGYAKEMRKYSFDDRDFAVIVIPRSTKTRREISHELNGLRREARVNGLASI